MTESQELYSGTSNGITYAFSIYKYGKNCSFSCNFNGTNQIDDPILFTLPFKFRPAVRVRVAGYPNSGPDNEMIIYSNGNVGLSGSTGSIKPQSEVGCGYVSNNF